MLASISFNQSHKSSLSHNNREHSSGNKDIDEARSHLNIQFVKEDIREVYEELFQESVDAYNSKQSRQDRKIENYYEKIHNDSKTHEQRELVVAIGEGKDPEELRGGKREALIKYAEEFQERNKNLQVYNMVLHDDEANPHLHINYVPYFESARGLSKRVGMDKALKEQGVEGKGTQLIGKWRELETSRIEELAKEYIPDFERANVGSHKYMKVQEYKEYAETLNTVQQEVENQKSDLEAIEDIKEVEKAKLSELEQHKSGLVDEIKNKSFELKKVERDLFSLERGVEDKNNELKQSSAKLVQLKEETSKIEVPLFDLESIKETKLFKKVTVSEADYDMIKNMAKKSLSENKVGLELEKENHSLKKQIKQHQIKGEDLERRVNVLSEQKEKHREKALHLEKENKKLLQERNIFKRLYEHVKEWMKSKGVDLDFERMENNAKRNEKQKEKTLELDR